MADGPRKPLFTHSGVWSTAACLALARIFYLVFVCPYELAADEAQYWDWSRHLDLSYYSKGPGIAWLIAASTRPLGHSEWAIRLPAVLSILAATITVVHLARRAAAPSNIAAPAARAALIAFCCIPAYHATAILMTIDAPYLACWALAALAAWSIMERARAGVPALRSWIALAAALGIGFLFKYTILLLLPGLLLVIVLERPRSLLNAATFRRIAVAGVFFAVVVSPVIIWNARHGWPTLAHLLGHLGAPGGDAPRAAKPWSYDPRWTLEFLGTQLGFIGPLLVVIALSVRLAWRSRGEFPVDWRAARFAVCLAAPILTFYLAVSCVTDAEGNWPIAGYLTLLVPVALAVARGAARARGFFRAAWHWSVGYGVAAALGLLTLNLLDRVPFLKDEIPYHRISGHREFAAMVDVQARAHSPAGVQPIFIADQYTRTALLAYYLPGRPAVHSATSFLGGRKSSYDYFPGTSLRRAELLGRDAALVGSVPERWNAAFEFDCIDPLIEKALRRPAVYLGVNYRGPIDARVPPADHP